MRLQNISSVPLIFRGIFRAHKNQGEKCVLQNYLRTVIQKTLHFALSATVQQVVCLLCVELNCCCFYSEKHNPIMVLNSVVCTDLLSAILGH